MQLIKTALSVAVLQVIERLYNAKHENSETHYGAFYSSELGGITTDPALMLIHMDDHMVHRGHGVFDTALITDGFVYQVGLTDPAMSNFRLHAGFQGAGAVPGGAWEANRHAAWGSSTPPVVRLLQHRSPPSAHQHTPSLDKRHGMAHHAECLVWNPPSQLPRHLERLKRSAEAAGLALPRSDEAIMRIILDTAAASKKLNGACSCTCVCALGWVWQGFEAGGAKPSRKG